MNKRKSWKFDSLSRFGSSSSQTSQNSGDFCRICHEADNISPLLTPCMCSGSLRYVHEMCLIQWLTASETNSCELCKFPFIMQSKIKPFNEVFEDLVISLLKALRMFLHNTIEVLRASIFFLNILDFLDNVNVNRIFFDHLCQCKTKEPVSASRQHSCKDAN